jgi:hypothetical protein
VAGLLASILWLTAAPGAKAQGTALEFAVKATYLYKFAPFVEWPPHAFPTAASPFNICVLGDDPFGVVLDHAVEGQRVGEHPIVVRRLPAAEPGMSCHVLFAGGSATQSPADMVRAVTGQPVLTVTDQASGSSGGIIQFILQDGRVRFAIDAAAAQASGVPISSKLLALALSVRR